MQAGNVKLTCGGVHEGDAIHFQVLPDDEGLDSAHVQAGLGVLHAKDKLASVLADLIKELADQPLLLYKFDVRQGISRELNRLVEAILAACINMLQHEESTNPQLQPPIAGQCQACLSSETRCWSCNCSMSRKMSMENGNVSMPMQAFAFLSPMLSLT